MKSWYIAILALCLSSNASAAIGTPIPLTVTSARIEIDPGSGSSTGMLPHSHAFNGSFGSCTADGSVDVTNDSGRLQVRAHGTVAGSGCSLVFSVYNFPVAINVPFGSGTATPVLFRLENTQSILNGVQMRDTHDSANIQGFYESQIADGDVSVDGAIGLVARTQPGASGSQLVDMIPGDSVLFDPTWVNTGTNFVTSVKPVGGGGNFDITYEISASLPPGASVSAIPPFLGWLIGGIVIGLGVKMTRKA